MSLAAGQRIGAFEITGSLGAGGMGEVYRATDTKLKRQVAIKILPGAVARDADRLARFRREAEVLASLNHPNIAAIYGFEDASGIHALVLELVEGRTLEELLAARALPLDEALKIARQIGDALEAAHELRCGALSWDRPPRPCGPASSLASSFLPFVSYKNLQAQSFTAALPIPDARAGAASGF